MELEIITNFPKDQEFRETEQNYLNSFKEVLKSFQFISKAKYLITSTTDYALHTWVIDFEIPLTSPETIRKQLENDLTGITNANAFSIINSCSLSSKSGTRIMVNCIENF